MVRRYKSALSRTAAIVIVIIIVIAAIAAFFIFTQAPPQPSPTSPTSPSPSPTTSTPPPTPSLTGDFRVDAISLGRYFEARGINEIKYTVWAAGDPNSVMRMYGIVEGAEKINAIWSEEGINVEVTVEKYWQDSFHALYDEFLSAVPQGTNGDFFVNSYVFIASLAEEGYILDITSYVNAYSSEFADFYTPLMKAAQYGGKYYGVPQDTEARPLYIRKDVADCMNWDLTDLAERVKNGEFTWYEVYEKAMAAKEAGCSTWGLIHRKGSAHPDLIQFIFAFGGELYDEAENKLVVDKEAIYKWFAVEYAFARAGLLPEDIMAWDWAQQIHPTIVSGDTLFDIGGTWYWTEWQTKKYYTDPETGEARALTPEEVAENFYYTLFPAGEPGKSPVTLSQPFMWMIASNAGKDNPGYNEHSEAYHMLAFLIVVGASDAEINAVHSIISAHVPVRKAAADLLNDESWIQRLVNLELDLSDETKNAIRDIVAATAKPENIAFLADVSYMLDYTKLAPSHPLYPKLADIFKEAIDKVIRGALTPEEAVNYVIQKIQADPDLSGNVLIVGEIPSGWEFP